ncbi:copper chaperone CopZ [Shouchella sp. 1P09AA]|uniref:copper chaperone CopZ n=1 Tax=Bacillaceae TaxID=186817 RepID=UPI000C0738C4|nr:MULTISPECIES: copper chaperone CopZ [Bacillaceae]UTR04931.1 copper chaperone CopZ [Alkalihalobacillus sp. LMS6]
MEQSIIKVSGMSCQHCVKSIEQALGSLDGVEQVDVALDKEEVSVRYKKDLVSLDGLENEIEEQGYDVKK